MDQNHKVFMVILLLRKQFHNKLVVLIGLLRHMSILFMSSSVIFHVYKLYMHSRFFESRIIIINVMLIERVSFEFFKFGCQMIFDLQKLDFITK